MASVRTTCLSKRASSVGARQWEGSAVREREGVESVFDMLAVVNVLPISLSVFVSTASP